MKVNYNRQSNAIGGNLTSQIQFQIHAKPSGLSWLPEEDKPSQQLFVSEYLVCENGGLLKQKITEQNKKGGGKRKPVKTKVKKQFALPKLVKEWVDANFGEEKSRETAYLYAYSAQLQIQNRHKWHSDFICLPASTLKKHITDKNLSKIKSVFENGKIVFKEGKKKTINNQLMNVYDFNRSMFLDCELVVVSVNKFVEKERDEKMSDNDMLSNTIPNPLSSKEEGDGINLVYIVRNLPQSAQFTSSTTQNSLIEPKWGEKTPENSEIAQSANTKREIAQSAKPIQREIAHAANTKREIAHPVLKLPSPFPAINKRRFQAEEINEYTKTNLRKLKIDLNKLRNLIPDQVEKSVGKIEVITTNHPDKVAGYKYLGGTDKIYYDKIHSIISKLKHGQSLMKYKEDWIVGSYQQYVELKRKQIKESLLLNIQSLSNPECFSSFLSDTNGRLFHNLSNVWGGFRELIMMDNNLVEIDIANSQMAFLAKELMRDHNFVFCNPDVDNFVSHAGDGVLYDRIAKNMDTTKDFAKQITFNIIFNPSTKANQLAKGFEKHYPNVYQYCTEFKKIYGGNALAIYLQKLESDVMIKLIYNLLMENKLFSLTMHDSIICRAEDLEMVQDIMKRAFYDITFHAKLRIKNPQQKEVLNKTLPPVNTSNNPEKNCIEALNVQISGPLINGSNPEENFGRISTATGTDYFGSYAKKNKEPKPLTQEQMEWAESLNWEEILADETEPAEKPSVKVPQLTEEDVKDLMLEWEMEAVGQSNDELPDFSADMFE